MNEPKIRLTDITVTTEDNLFDVVSQLIDESRKQVVKAVNTAMVYTYYGVGQYIVEYEQGGTNRAEYGKGVLKRLSKRLTEKYGRGWSVDTLEKARRFFLVYSKSATLSRKSAIIDKLQQFLLECGKGFLFEARQKRFTFDEDYFYVDLVLYNRILQCYVLVDLKMGKLTHQDLGQMQMYVNYFDRYVRLEFEKPTIGILLCEQKNNSVVELTLPKDANIYAQQYALCLPRKEELQAKLREWIDEYNEFNQQNDNR